MTDDRWQEALRRLAVAPRVTIDLETSGLDWKKNFVCGWVLTFSPNPADSYYLPVRHQPGGNLLGFRGPQAAEGWDETLHPVEPDILKALDRQDLQVWGFNLGFDLKFAMRLGFTLRPSFRDGIINAALIDEHRPSYSLESCAADAGVAAKKSELIKTYLISKFPDEHLTPRNAMGHFWRLAGDDPMAVEYAEGDGTSTDQLIRWQDAELAAQELGKVHGVESALTPVLARMSFKGIRVDEERLHWLKGHITERLDALLATFPPDFSSRSSTAVQKWCVDHGETGWPLTPTGKPSFAEAWLETHDAGRQIIQLRKLDNLRNSFVNPLLETHLWRGRVHTDFNQLRGDEYGTVTGRLSSSNPNLQQVPKRNRDLGKLFRSVFVPDEGMIWGDADFRQCEPVILAYYSRAKVLIEGFTAIPPVDAHAAVTRAMRPDWRDMPDDEFAKVSKTLEFKDARETGKRINQTLITGGGKGVLVKKYKMQDVDRAWNDYFRAMPEIRDLQKRAARRFEQRGYLVSLLGRRARLVDRNKSYTGVNRLLQVGNADVLKAKLVQIDEYLASEGRPIDVLNNVHDALSFQFDNAQRMHYTECLRIMTDFSPGQLIEMDVPLGVDAGEGPTWGIATYGEQ